MILIFYIDFIVLILYISDKLLNNLKFIILYVYVYEKIFIFCDFIKVVGNKVGFYIYYFLKNYDK